MKQQELIDLLKYLISLPKENEWVEFKVDNEDPMMIGERLSALANSACLENEPFGYLVYGVVDETHEVVGKTWAETDRQERLMACYQHACIKYVNHQVMTNQSLRERFNIEEQNAAMVSRVIRDAIAEGLVKEEDPDNASRKFKRYIPYWA